MLARKEWNEQPERDAFSIPLTLDWLGRQPFNRLMLVALPLSAAAHVAIGYLVHHFG